MIKLIKITNHKMKEFLLVIGVDGTENQIEIPYNKDFERIVGKFNQVDVFNGIGERISKELILNSNTLWGKNNKSIDLSKITINETNLESINKTIETKNGFLLLNNSKISITKLLLNTFSLRNKIILSNFNDSNFDEIKKIISLKKKKELKFKDNSISKQLERFISNFILEKPLIKYFTNKDVIISKKNNIYHFLFKDYEIVEDSILSKIKGFSFEKKNIVDTSISVKFGMNGNLIKKGEDFEIISGNIKGFDYSQKEFCKDLFLLKISFKEKILYFYNYYIEEQRIKHGELIDTILSAIETNKESWFKYFIKGEFIYNYVKDDDKKKFVKEQIYNYYNNLLFIMIKYTVNGKEGVLTELLEKYRDYIKEQLISKCNIKKFDLYIKSNIDEYILNKERIVEFTKKYVRKDNLNIIETNLNKIYEGFKIEYFDIISDNILSDKEIETLFTYFNNKK